MAMAGSMLHFQSLKRAPASQLELKIKCDKKAYIQNGAGEVLRHGLAGASNEKPPKSSTRETPKTPKSYSNINCFYPLFIPICITTPQIILKLPKLG